MRDLVGAVAGQGRSFPNEPHPQAAVQLGTDQRLLWMVLELADRLVVVDAVDFVFLGKE